MSTFAWVNLSNILSIKGADWRVKSLPCTPILIGSQVDRMALETECAKILNIKVAQQHVDALFFAGYGFCFLVPADHLIAEAFKRCDNP